MPGGETRVHLSWITVMPKGIRGHPRRSQMRTKVSQWGLGCPRVSHNEKCDHKQVEAGCKQGVMTNCFKSQL